MDKKLSVLIPVFNREEYIAEAIFSIINQTYKDFDIIVYDDGSTDNTVKIVKEIAKAYKNIYIIGSRINRGGVYSKVQLIKESKTDIICYQDSDDISNPLRLEKQITCLDKNSSSFCGWRWFNKHKNKIYYKTAYGRCSASIMFKKDMYILPNPKFILSGGDVDFINRYLKAHSKTVTLSDILYDVRNHEDRIGVWKKKFREKIPVEIRTKLSYKALLDYYKTNCQK